MAAGFACHTFVAGHTTAACSALKAQRDNAKRLYKAKYAQAQQLHTVAMQHADPGAMEPRMNITYRELFEKLELPDDVESLEDKATTLQCKIEAIKESQADVAR